jgi:hypothetical protein
MPCSRTWSSLPLSQRAGTGHLVPGSRTQVTPAPSASRSVRADPAERHETPDPVRPDAVNPRFHGVRHLADLHDQHTLTGNTVLVVLM